MVPRVPEPECRICNDARWVALAPLRPDAPPNLAPCSCQGESRSHARHLETYAGLGPLADRTFDTLDERGRRGIAERESFRQAAARAKQFAEQPDGWLVIAGPVSGGKSHLAAAITNAISASGQPAKYVSLLDLGDILRAIEFGPDADEATTTWDAIVAAPALVLDDFGAQPATTRIDARIDQLLTHRASGPLPTVIVLARPLADLQERFRERLQDPALSTIVEIARDARSVDAQDRVPPAMLERMTFETFDPNGHAASNATQREALHFALERAKAFAEDPGHSWLYLHGGNGVGKTHLAVAVAARLTAQGNPPTFWRVPELLDSLRHTFSSGAEASFFDRFAAVKNAPVLILDDFASVSMTDWTLEKLFQLICHRFDRQLPTMLTSKFIIWEDVRNPAWQRLETNPLWESIVSRLRDMSVVKDSLMDAPDYRDRGG